VKEHEGDVNQEVLVLNNESVAPTETARGVLNFGFSTIHMKVYKGDSNAASSSAGNPAEQVLLRSWRHLVGRRTAQAERCERSDQISRTWTSATQRRATSLWWRLQL